VTSRATLGASDTVDWLQVGVDGEGANSPFSATSTQGLPLTVSDGAGHNFFRYDEGIDWEGRFGGNFTIGDHLLYNNAWGFISVSSSMPLAAIGTQIQSLGLGPFVARVTAYDSGANLLGSFTESGVSNQNKDGSAIFIGVENTLPTDTPIASVVYSLDSANGDGRAFAINQLSLLTQSPAQSVPEPPTSTMVCILAMGTGLVSWRRACSS
jgi:hypothetical protein